VDASPADFIFKALKSGIKNIVSFSGEDNFLPSMKEGTKVETRRHCSAKPFCSNWATTKTPSEHSNISRKAVYITEECVGCDKCVFNAPTTP
jgi:hypothetical protein